MTTPPPLAACPQRAVEFILEFEGIDQPGKWPGSDSGITLGAGFDLGFHTAAQFAAAWDRHLSLGEIKRLQAVCGIKGAAAAKLASQFRDIRISKDAAHEVFTRVTLPRWREETWRAFPGMSALPEMAQGMLVSLVFNRGASMSGERRREMRLIRDEIARLAQDKRTVAAATKLIAGYVKSMKRLWPTVRGLRLRREVEAATILDSLL